MPKTAPQENFEPLPPVGGIVKWVEAEKADVLRALPADELRDIRERVMVILATKLETTAIKAVGVLDHLMDHAEKDADRLKAADRALSFFDKPNSMVAVQINNKPQFQSHLGLPAAPPMVQSVTVVPEKPPMFEPASRPEPTPETWVTEEPQIAKVP